MKLVFTSYVNSPEYDRPEAWLKRIEANKGILEDLSNTHHVIGIERINYEGEYRQQGVHYFFINLKRKTTYFPFRIHGLIKRLKPDVVFVNGFIFPLQIIQLRLALGKAVKIIVLHRAEKPFTGIKKYLQKLADKCVNAYLFSSADFKEQWKKNIDTAKIHEVIQSSSVFYPVDKGLAKKTLGIKSGPVFLWVGRLNANKDPLTVLKAFIKFLRVQSSARLYMIYGTKDLLPEIKELIEINQVSQSIILIGSIQHDQLLHWYNSADFIISGSHYEGGGAAITEAMSCGCIPVITNISSFRMLTANGEHGFLYEAGNEKDLLATLFQTVKINIEEKRTNVLQHFTDELSFEAIGRKINVILTDQYV